MQVAGCTLLGHFEFPGNCWTFLYKLALYKRPLKSLVFFLLSPLVAVGNGDNKMEKFYRHKRGDGFTARGQHRWSDSNKLSTWLTQDKMRKREREIAASPVASVGHALRNIQLTWRFYLRGQVCVSVSGDLRVDRSSFEKPKTSAALFSYFVCTHWGPTWATPTSKFSTMTFIIFVTIWAVNKSQSAKPQKRLTRVIRKLSVSHAHGNEKKKNWKFSLTFIINIQINYPIVNILQVFKVQHNSFHLEILIG